MEKIIATSENLVVKNFLSIRTGSFALGNITAVIGPQASGKSIIAKLIYFGRNYISSFFSEIVDHDFDLRKFKSDQLKEFLDLFGGLIGYDKTFDIKYNYGNLVISVTRSTDNGRPKISISNSFGAYAKHIEKAYKKFLSDWQQDAMRKNRSPSKYLFFRESKSVSEFYSSVPSALFVPASRSFYSTVSDELFTYLAADERVDSLTAQFGSFYEFAKRKASGEHFFASDNAEYTKTINSRIEPVIDGTFVREKSKDFIQTKWGRVPLRSSSSGQQEALPLLFSLLEYPGRQGGPHLLIIEEPEAHLFPTAQKYILDLMVERAIETNCDILFTTHSPYVLACLNNHILRISKTDTDNPRKVKVNGYATGVGEIRSIVDSESNFLDTNYLDSVSEDIAREYLEI